VRFGGWAAAGAAAALALLSGWADHRRRRRADLDRISMIDWRTVQIAAIAGAIISVSLALNG
jgi:hypothetical protein